MLDVKSLFWILVGFVVAAPVRAATQVEETWGSYGGNGFFNWEYHNSDAYGDARHRLDTERHRFFSSTPHPIIDIERIDLDKRWQIDPVKKRYTEESISAAREKARKDAEKSLQEWEKQQKKNEKTEPAKEPNMRIRSAETRVTGPGPAEMINGFSCRPYTVKTTIEFESLPDHKPAGRQVYFQKQWTSESPILMKYREDEMDYWKKALGAEMNKQEIKKLQEAIQKQLTTNDKDASVKAWTEYWTAIGKIKGYPIRTLAGFTVAPADAEAHGTQGAKAETETSKDESVVQPGDFAGGLGGLAGGVASRWASKKVEQKVNKKMSEHPVWVDEMAKELDGAMIGWGWMTEIKSAKTLNAGTDLFDLPTGYKKVGSL